MCDELERKIVFSTQDSSTYLKILTLIGSFSVAASNTKSEPAMST